MPVVCCLRRFNSQVQYTYVQSEERSCDCVDLACLTLWFQTMLRFQWFSFVFFIRPPSLHSSTRPQQKSLLRHCLHLGPFAVFSKSTTSVLFRQVWRRGFQTNTDGMLDMMNRVKVSPDLRLKKTWIKGAIEEMKVLTCVSRKTEPPPPTLSIQAAAGRMLQTAVK